MSIPQNVLLEEDPDEQGTDLLDAMQDHMYSYDERLYFAAKEYISFHQLHHKQQTRKSDHEMMPLRYKLLMMWQSPLSSRMGVAFFVFQVILVLATIIQLMYETAPRYDPIVQPKYTTMWQAMEFPIATCFLLDLIAHFFLLPPQANDFSRHSRRDFFRQFDTWIDIASILPTTLIFFENDFPEVRLLDFLKAFRILRVSKVLRQLHSVDQLAYTLEKCFEPLLGPFLFLFGLVFTFAAAIYFAERGTLDEKTGFYMIDDCSCLRSAARALDPTYPCPRKITKFISIPHTMWFTLVSMTTVGYGDMIPVCGTGKMLAVLAMVCGNVLTAMPIAIVGTYFTNIVIANRARRLGASHVVFGRGTGNALRMMQRPQQSDVFHDDASRLGDRGGTNSSSRQTLTMGGRLAKSLSAVPTVCDLLAPPGVLLHLINAFATHEFESFISTIASKDGVQQVKDASQRATQLVALELVSAPATSQLPATVFLNRPIGFSIGIRSTSEDISRSTMSISSGIDADAGNLFFSQSGCVCRGIPLKVLHAVLDPQRQYILVTPVFPARVTLNGMVLNYDLQSRLLVGDVLAIHQNFSDPPTISYQFVKVEVSGTLQRVREGRAVKALPPPDAAQVVTLSVAPPRANYRSLTFGHFAPTYAQGSLEYEEL